MAQTIFYALDFDGVIGDSAVETSITGWKAACCLWNDFDQTQPPEAIIEQFRLVRPIMETGYEAILIIRLLYMGENAQSLLGDYQTKINRTIQSSKKDIAALKQLFGETRDHWIQQDIHDWITMNPLFLGIAEKLNRLNQQNNQWVIITTKQERFVSQILAAHNIELAPHNIYGLDRKMDKEAILIELLGKNPQKTFYFYEDRLPMLQKVLNNPQLQNVKLFFATWGYNTQEDKNHAEQNPRIESINLQDFLA